MKVYLRGKVQAERYRTSTTFLSGTDLVKHLRKFTSITAGRKKKQRLDRCGITFGQEPLLWRVMTGLRTTF